MEAEQTSQDSYVTHALVKKRIHNIFIPIKQYGMW